MARCDVGVGGIFEIRKSILQESPGAGMVLVWASQPRRPMTEAKFRDNFSAFQLISVDFPLTHLQHIHHTLPLHRGIMGVFVYIRWNIKSHLPPNEVVLARIFAIILQDVWLYTFASGGGTSNFAERVLCCPKRQDS